MKATNEPKQTLLDEFAKAALIGLLSGRRSTRSYPEYAKRAYSLAYEMLKARELPEEEVTKPTESVKD